MLKAIKNLFKKSETRVIYDRLKKLSNQFDSREFDTNLGKRRVETGGYERVACLTYVDYDDVPLFTVISSKDEYGILCKEGVDELAIFSALYEIEQILAVERNEEASVLTLGGLYRWY